MTRKRRRKCPRYLSREDVASKLEIEADKGAWSIFFFSSRRRHTRSLRDWSSDVCSSDLVHRRGGHLPHAVSERSAGHVGHAGLLIRSGEGRRLDALLARGRIARRRPRCARAIRRLQGGGARSHRTPARRKPADGHPQERLQAGARDGLEQRLAALSEIVRGRAAGALGDVAKIVRHKNTRPTTARVARAEA